ncbi:membrane-associated protein, putative [Bodo saltans]|uniref:Membrane-associated protein, putative n=1 Tax=Bodo saltans TaxID=75058 RepID=A0A0S4J854_BODSA|nr:membrane-associated protein, putative [Bodo saltans]|eukprot:CUG87686.1 membrane-associated protein, putative [Bodo saltans]
MNIAVRHLRHRRWPDSSNRFRFCMIVALALLVVVFQLSLLITGRGSTNSRVSSYDNTPQQALLSKNMLFRSVVHAAPYEAVTTLCIGIPHRPQLVVADDGAFVRQLRATILASHQLRRVVFYITTRGEDGMSGATRMARELVQGTTSTADNDSNIAEHDVVMESMQPFALADNATLGSMMNHMLMQFTTRDGVALYRCSHLLLLDPSHVPTNKHFLPTMLRDIHIDNAVGATCSSIFGASTNATNPLAIVYQPQRYVGYNVTRSSSSLSLQGAVVRRNTMTPDETTERTPQFEMQKKHRKPVPVHLLSSYCMLVDLRELMTRTHTMSNALQIPHSIAIEPTDVDVSFLKEDRHTTIEKLTYWSTVLAEHLNRISANALKTLPEAQRNLLRRAFQTSLDAQHLLTSLVLTPVQTTAGDNATEHWKKTCNKSQSLESVFCMARKTAEQMRAAAQPSALSSDLHPPPEEHIGWSLSLVLYDLLFGTREVTNGHDGNVFIASQDATCAVAADFAQTDVSSMTSLTNHFRNVHQNSLSRLLLTI